MKARVTLWIAGVCALLLLSGCVQTFNPNEKVFSKFYATNLGLSSSANVLGYLQDPSLELLSQSERVAVSWGQQDDGQTHWFNMVVFDEEDLTAVRKYAFSQVEQRLYVNAAPDPLLRFDAAMFMEPEILDAEYPTQNARYIAVLDAVRDRFHDDADEVIQDSEVLHGSSLMVNRTLNAILNKLYNSPALAAQLPRLEGLEFVHPTLGESRVRMLIEDGTVKLKIKASDDWFDKKPFEEQPDVQNM